MLCLWSLSRVEQKHRRAFFPGCLAKANIICAADKILWTRMRPEMKRTLKLHDLHIWKLGKTNLFVFALHRALKALKQNTKYKGDTREYKKTFKEQENVLQWR